MPALSAARLRKSFGPQIVLDDATFTLGRGEKVGLIGANGAGKSTFARILAGLEAPDAGTLSTRRGLTVRYLAQEPAFDPERPARALVEDALTAWRAATFRHASLTAQLAQSPSAEHRESFVAEQAELDDTIVRLGGWERGHEALGFLDRLGVRDIDAPCGIRSGGERRRIALAQLLVASPDVAILDEPTNHLDADTAAWLEVFLAREFRGAVLLVTHDRYFLDAVVQRIVELERGCITTFSGGYGDYLEKKAELLLHEERVDRNRQNALRREREWMARGPKARSTKQKARIVRAVALEAESAASAERPDAVTFSALASPHQGKTVLELQGLEVAAASGAAALNAPLDLVVTAGERIGIVGPNGVGKTTVLRAVLAAALEARHREPIAGSPTRTAGNIVVGKNTRVAYLDQARESLDDTQSIFDNVRGEGGASTIETGFRGRERLELRSYLELFAFDAGKQRQKVGSLSGGERARVALARVLREGANLLLLDEPTNDLDLPTLGAVEEMLQTFSGSVLVITHDRAFLDRVATAILAFEADASGPGVARVTRYSGGYTDFVAQRGDARKPAEPETPRPSPASTGSKPRPKGGLTYAERLELDGIVDAIEVAERTVAEVEALLADPALYAKRGHEVPLLKARHEAARAHAAELVARWDVLESRKG
jgi:ATP-binding cassette subfamily F protein uup